IGRDEQERRRIAEIELYRHLDLLITAARREERELGAQTSVDGGEAITGLEARQRLGPALDALGREIVDRFEIHAAERRVEAAGLVAARELYVGRPTRVEQPIERNLTTAHVVLRREAVARRIDVIRVAALVAQPRRQREPLVQVERDLAEQRDVRRREIARREILERALRVAVHAIDGRDVLVVAFVEVE